MKKLFAIFLLLPLYVGAQDTCRIKLEVDQFSREKRLTSGFIKLNGTAVSIVADSREIKFLFSFAANTCFSDTSTAQVFFEGNRVRTSYKNNSAMNCDGLFTFIYRNAQTTTYALQKLASLKITSIRFRATSGQVIDVNFTEEQKLLFRRAAACIAIKAKELIPASN